MASCIKKSYLSKPLSRDLPDLPPLEREKQLKIIDEKQNNIYEFEKKIVRK